MATGIFSPNERLRFSCGSELGIDLLHSLREAEGRKKCLERRCGRVRSDMTQIGADGATPRNLSGSRTVSLDNLERGGHPPTEGDTRASFRRSG
jgi:hypothetical protein